MINLGNVVGLLKSTTAPTKKYVIWAKILNPSFPDIVELNYWDEISLAWIPLTDPTTQYWLRPVISILSTPPGSPVEGDRYLIGSSPSGVWAGKTDQVATFKTGAWQYLTPLDGFIVSNRSEVNKLYDYRGSYGAGGAWFVNDFQVPIAPNQYIPVIEKGLNGGVATLDAGGKVPNSQLDASAFVYTPQNPGQWSGGTATIWSALEQLRTLVSAGAAYTFTNGLDNTGGTVKWKGPLTESTLITHNDKYIFFENATAGGIQSSLGVTASGTVNSSVYKSATDRQVYYQLSDGNYPIFQMGAEDVLTGYTASFYIASFNGNIQAYGDYDNAAFTVDFSQGIGGTINLLATAIAITGPLTIDTGVGSLGLFSTDIQFSDANNISGETGIFPGLRYLANYSANFTARSLVDKAYVDSVVGVGGWSVTGTTTLTGDAYIAGGHALGFGGQAGDPLNRVTEFEVWSSGDLYMEEEFVNGASTYYNALSFVSSGSPSNTTVTTLSATRVASGVTYQGSFQAQVFDSTGVSTQMRAQRSTTGTTNIVLYDNANGAYVGSTIAGFTGLQYSADYSTNYTDRSLVDKGYVASILGTGLTFTNGVSKVGSTVRLGGSGALTTPAVIGIDTDFGIILDTNTTYWDNKVVILHSGDLNGPVYSYVDAGPEYADIGSINGNYQAYQYATTAVDNAQATLASLFSTASAQAFATTSSATSASMMLQVTTALGSTQLALATTGIEHSMSINSTAPNFAGVTYVSDYTANFTSLSLVHKAYADTKAVVSGSNTYVQYNNGGALGSHVNFRYDFVKFNLVAAPITLTGGDIDWNNNAIFGEGHTIFTQPSGGGTVTDAAVFGWGHEIGDGTTWFGGSSGFTYGAFNKNTGAGCFVGGERARTIAGAQRSFVVALNAFDDTFPYVTVGSRAFNVSNNSAAQTEGHGALALYSAILGGQDHNIPSDSPRSVILGGSAIKARAADPNQVYVPSLNIATVPSNGDSIEGALVRDSNGLIKISTALPRVLSITPSNSELRNCGTTPFQLLPAPGAGNYIVLHRIDYKFTGKTVAYNFTGSLCIKQGNQIVTSWGSANNTVNTDEHGHGSGGVNDQPANQAITLTTTDDLNASTGNGVLTITLHYTIKSFT